MLFVHSLIFLPEYMDQILQTIFMAFSSIYKPMSAAAIENVTENRVGLRPAKLIFHVIFHSEEIIFYYQANTIIKISPSFRGAMTDTFLPSALKAQSCFYSNQVSHVYSIIHWILGGRGNPLILPLHTKIEKLANLINRILLKSQVRF